MKDKLRQRAENHQGWHLLNATSKLTAAVINLSVNEHIWKLSVPVRLTWGSSHMWEAITWGAFFKKAVRGRTGPSFRTLLSHLKDSPTLSECISADSFSWALVISSRELKRQWDAMYRVRTTWPHSQLYSLLSLELEAHYYSVNPSFLICRKER